MDKEIHSKKDLTTALFIINAGQTLTRIQAANALGYLLSEEGAQDRETYLGAILVSPMSRGATTAEVHGFLDAACALDNFFAEKPVRPDIPGNELLIGAVGSGKKGIKTINVSTLSGLVIASCGPYFSKPVSKSTSSVTGSADILELCGARLDLPKDEMIGVLKQAKFAAFSIEKQIPKFDKMYGGKFWAPHALSLALPALLTPIKLDHLIYGLSASPIVTSAQVLAERGIENFTVVSSTPDGIRYVDEACPFGKTSWITTRKGEITENGTIDIHAEQDLQNINEAGIAQRSTQKEQLRVFLNIASGKMPGSYQEMISLNAAFMMKCSRVVETLDEGLKLARRSLRLGAPRDILDKFVRLTNG